jgi:hypothetical protein
VFRRPARRQRRSTDSRVAMRAKSLWPIGLARAKGSMRTWAPGLIVFFPDFERPGESFPMHMKIYFPYDSL